MDAHTRKTFDALTHGRAPRDLEWRGFVSFWDSVADDVEQESGDRLVVHYQGHRAVFRRAHDGLVPLADVERARHLLNESTEPTESTSGDALVAVAIDAEHARILQFDLAAAGTEDTERTVRDTSPNARRLRAVERKRGHDDVADLDAYFDEVAAALTGPVQQAPFVVLGHGRGKADVATAFVARLEHSHTGVAHRLRGIGDVDLSAATDADLEAAARAALAT